MPLCSISGTDRVWYYETAMRDAVLVSGMLLRHCYATCGTDGGYGATGNLAVNGTNKTAIARYYAPWYPTMVLREH